MAAPLHAVLCQAAVSVSGAGLSIKALHFTRTQAPCAIGNCTDGGKRSPQSLSKVGARSYPSLSWRHFGLHRPLPVAGACRLPVMMQHRGRKAKPLCPQQVTTGRQGTQAPIIQSPFDCSASRFVGYTLMLSGAAAPDSVAAPTACVLCPPAPLRPTCLQLRCESRRWQGRASHLG